MGGPPLLAGGGELIGLGRSIYAIFERNMISHALDSIQSRLRKQGSQPVANFVAMRIVEELEVIEIDEQQGAMALPTSA